jgi:hypothetical protein
MSSKTLEIDGFRSAISGNIDSTTSIIKSFLALLASKLGHILDSDGARDRLRLSISAAEREDRSSVAAMLAWPPVSRILLRRPQTDEPALRIAELLDGAKLLPEVGATPDSQAVPAWLDRNDEWYPLPAPTSCLDLTAALDLLELSVGASELVRLCTSAVVLCEHPDRRVSGSWSSDELIGCTVLINIGRGTDTTTVAEALLHEAIHHCQAMVEVFRPFILEPNIVTTSIRYPSPWTGQPLTFKSLLAATFVWFGLALHWKRVSERVDSQDARVRCRRAVRGFVEGDPARTIAQCSWALDPVVPPLVSSLQDEVRDLWLHRA